MKYFNTFLILFLVVTTFFSNNIALAQKTTNTTSVGKGNPTSYQTLTQIPGISQNGVVLINKNSLGDFLVVLFNYTIGIAIALAVIMVTWGGVLYATTDAVGGKSDGKEKIKNAFIGLALALGSYLLLNTINPDLLKFNLNIGALKPVSLQTQQGAMTSGQDSTTQNKGDWTEAMAQQAIDGDSVKSRLSVGGIKLNSNNCTMEKFKTWRSNEPPGCTAYGALGESAIRGLIGLKTACPTCAVTVTGGTEWGHISHRPGSSYVDLRIGDPLLDSYIKKFPSGPSTCNSGPTYRVTGVGAGAYCDEGGHPEGAHWHVSY